MREISSPLDGFLSPFGQRRGVFSPASLFAGGEEGTWLDTSDISVLFQDTAGTTPVTASGQTVGLFFGKSQGQTLGPELVTNGTFDTDTDWTKGTGWTISGGTANKTTADNTSISQTVTTTSGAVYAITFDVTVSSDSAGVRTLVNGVFSELYNTVGTYTVYFVATAASTIVYLNGGSFNGGSIDNISVREIAGNHATQPTVAARPSYIVDADGAFIQHDPVDDALTVTLPDLGTEATVAYVTRSEVRLLEDQTISGSYTLPQQELANFVVIDRALTFAEKVSLIRFLASKVECVTYGAEIDRLTLIAVNAVDVFVYDTSKDSDGGAWRTGALAQASSWYNETLNTATRGSRREFPAVAVIVAESDKVTIYDGDDPSLPMWMVFESGGSTPNWNYIISGGLSSVSAKNGVVSVGRNSLITFNFISDDALYIANTTARNWSGAGISARNSGADWGADLGDPLIVNSTVNDVAMTVLPDAPTDPATGLPVPTIAVATAGGVSVIKDDGTVVDSSSTTAFTSVTFNPSYRLFYATTGGNAVWYAESSDYTSGDGFGGTTGERYNPSTTPATASTSVNDLAASDTLNAGYASSLVRISENTTNPSEGMVAYTTSTYNTGWLPGDIKLAALSDTDDTDLVGGELVTNGTFDTDSDWTKGTGWTISGGVAQAAVGASSGLSQSIGQTAGNVYRITFTVSGRTAGFVFLSGPFKGPARNSNGTFTHFIVATNSVGQLSITKSADFDGAIDNVSVQLADADRSVANRGMIVNGTVTRTPVASGADLVAYGGFSASNYLEQPYNPDLDFGTGDFCVMGWVKRTASNFFRTLTMRGFYTGGAYAGSQLAVTTNGSDALRFTASDDGYATADEMVGSTLPLNVWSHFCVFRSGNTFYMYQEGQLTDSKVVTAASGSLSNASASLFVGTSAALGSAFIGSLALWRISATAPTAEQIAKIYEDEKVLFQENAQATLYGSSDAVTALAFDEDTQTLHAGTSAGRSIFEGLRRVGNTTTSVSTAISASGGLVVEK